MTRCLSPGTAVPLNCVNELKYVEEMWLPYALTWRGGLRVPMIPKATGKVLLVGQVEGEELD